MITIYFLLNFFISLNICEAPFLYVHAPGVYVMNFPMAVQEVLNT